MNVFWTTGAPTRDVPDVPVREQTSSLEHDYWVCTIFIYSYKFFCDTWKALKMLKMHNIGVCLLGPVGYFLDNWDSFPHVHSCSYLLPVNWLEAIWVRHLYGHYRGEVASIFGEFEIPKQNLLGPGWLNVPEGLDIFLGGGLATVRQQIECTYKYIINESNLFKYIYESTWLVSFAVSIFIIV